MKINIEIPTPLRPYTENTKRVELDTTSLKQALTQLVTTYPKLRPYLYDGHELRSYVNLYLNNEDIRYLDNGLESPLNEGDTISIIPSIAGGK